MYSAPESTNHRVPISFISSSKPSVRNLCVRGTTAPNPNAMKTAVRAPLWVGLAYSGFKTMHAAPKYPYVIRSVPLGGDRNTKRS